MSQPFPPDDRIYYVSDERLRAFRMLTPEQKLRWMEEVTTFLRLAKVGRERLQKSFERRLPDAHD
ncbi:hypothetical protein CCP3SC15_20031 [Gammaproteobacteria bacterium]